MDKIVPHRVPSSFRVARCQSLLQQLTRLMQTARRRIRYMNTLQPMHCIIESHCVLLRVVRTGLGGACPVVRAIVVQADLQSLKHSVLQQRRTAGRS